MKKIIIILVLLTLALPAFAGGNKESSDGFSGDYAFGGSTTTEPIFLATIEQWKTIYPKVRISYDSQGSSVGVKGILSGIYSLGGSSRDLKDSEIAEGARATIVALDGVAVIVNKATVPLANLTVEQVAAIYAGDIRNWKELGGRDAEIVVFNRDEASGTRDCFNETVVKRSDKKFMPEAAVVTSNGDMVGKVSSTPFSIGYCGFGYIDKDPGIKAVMINGQEPLEEKVISGAYPVARNLNIVHKGIPAEGTLEKAFIDFLLSDQGQAIVKEEGFIPIP